MSNKPFIHLFKTAKSPYFYDTCKNEIVTISDQIYNDLNNEIIKDNSDITYLKEQGYLSHERFKKIKNPANDIADYLYTNSFVRVILQITQQCNLRCSYCPYSAGEENKNYTNRSHNNKNMSFSVAKKAIDFLINNSRNTEKLMVTFYGGEPLLQFDLIKNCIEYSKIAGEGKKINFSMTTNGTLLTKEIMDYIIENKILLTISLDGPAIIHDKNRKVPSGSYSSYDKVIKNIRYLKNNHREYLKYLTLSTVIDPKENFKEVVDFFNNNPDICDLELISTIITKNYRVSSIEESKEFQNDYRYEKFKLFLSELGRLDKKYAPRIIKSTITEIRESIADKLITQTEVIPDEICPEGICIPALARMLIDVDGKFYVCEKVNENSEVTTFGDVYNGIDISKIKQLLNVANVTEDDCKNCWAVRFCRACALGADDGDKFSKERRKQSCEYYIKNAENLIKDYLMLSELKDQREVACDND